MNLTTTLPGSMDRISMRSAGTESVAAMLSFSCLVRVTMPSAVVGISASKVTSSMSSQPTVSLVTVMHSPTTPSAPTK